MGLMKKAPNCRYCNALMYQNDVDYKFKGNYDIYWNCPDCLTSCIEQIRFGQTFKELWRSEENGLKYQEIKHKIEIRR